MLPCSISKPSRHSYAFSRSGSKPSKVIWSAYLKVRSIRDKPAIDLTFKYADQMTFEGFDPDRLKA